MGETCLRQSGCIRTHHFLHSAAIGVPVRAFAFLYAYQNPREVNFLTLRPCDAEPAPVIDVDIGYLEFEALMPVVFERNWQFELADVVRDEGLPFKEPSRLQVVTDCCWLPGRSREVQGG